MGLKINNIEDFIEEEIVNTKSFFEELIDDEYEDEEDELRDERTKSEKDLAFELEGVVPTEKRSRANRKAIDELSDDVFEVNRFDRRLIFGNETFVSKKKVYKEKEYGENREEEQKLDDVFSLEDVDINIVSLLDKANKKVPKLNEEIEAKNILIEEKRNNPYKKEDKENVRLKSIFDKLDNNGLISRNVNRGYSQVLQDMLQLNVSFEKLSNDEASAVDSMFKWIIDSVSADAIPQSVRSIVFDTITKCSKIASKYNFVSWMSVISGITSILLKTLSNFKLLVKVCDKLAEYTTKHLHREKVVNVCRSIDSADIEETTSSFDINEYKTLSNEMVEILY